MKNKQSKKNLNKKSSKEYEIFKKSQKKLESSNSLISDNKDINKSKSINKLRLDYLKDGFQFLVKTASEGNFNEELYNTLFTLDCPDLALLAEGLRIISNFANHLKESKK